MLAGKIVVVVLTDIYRMFLANSIAEDGKIDRKCTDMPYFLFATNRQRSVAWIEANF
jgi:hypothetical protein